MKKALLLSIPITLLGIAISLSFRVYLAHNVQASTQTYYYTTIDLASIMAIVFIGFRSSMTVSYQKTKDANSITAIFLSILAATTLLSVFLFSYPIYLFVDGAVPTAYICILFLAFGIYIYYSNRLAMFRLYKSINMLSLLEPPLLIICFFALRFFGFEVLESLIFAVILQNITLAIYIKVSNLNLLSEPPLGKISLDTEKVEYLKNSALSSIEFVFGLTFIYMGIFFAKLYFGLEELANYQVVVKPIFMYTIMLFVFPIVKFVFPELSNMAQNQEISQIKNLQAWVRNYAMIATGTIMISMLLAGENGISVVFGAPYKDTFVLLILLLPALYFAIMNAFYISLLKAQNRFALSLLTRASSVVFFCLIFYLFQSFQNSFQNVILAITLSYMCVNIVCFLLTFKNLRG